MSTLLDLLPLIIFGLVFIGPVIVNVLKDISKKSERERSGMAEPQQDTASGSSLDDLAARRREELRREAARRRTQASAGPKAARPQSTAQDPANLTMAERIARARARAQYQDRAAQMGRAPKQDATQAEQRLREREAAAQAQRERERAQLQANAQRRQAEARQAARRRASDQARDAQAQAESEARQRAEQARRQRQQPQKRRRPTSSSVAAQPVVTPSVPAPGGIGTQQPSAATKPVTQSEVGSGRAQTRGSRQPTASLYGVNLTSRTLRNAFVLKELLERPVSLRDPAEIGDVI